MAKKKDTKGQLIIYKTLHRKLTIEQHEPHYKPLLGLLQIINRLDVSIFIWLNAMLLALYNL